MTMSLHPSLLSCLVPAAMKGEAPDSCTWGLSVGLEEGDRM